MDKVSIENDLALVELNITFFNDGVHDTIINATMTTFVETYDLISTITVRVPDSPSDNAYSYQFLRTSSSTEKFLNGNQGNFLSAIILKEIIKHLDFELKFPMKPVSFDQPSTFTNLE